MEVGHAHRCLDTKSATSDDAAMHFATRTHAPANFAAGCACIHIAVVYSKLVLTSKMQHSWGRDATCQSVS